MKYGDGQASLLGDIVALGGKRGKVVSDIDGGHYLVRIRRAGET